ncbi:MAG: M28 family peptidase [Candidatus Latescibacteria bacterium]|nr:M28 family peptidase [Candidatus Latescibacterota bacterium]
MKKYIACMVLFAVSVALTTEIVYAVELDTVLREVKKKISGNRARDYTMRLWQYDKWYTVPMMNKAAKEAQSIMKERKFDEAEIVDTPLDGVTQYGTWTNPIGWDVKQATLEIIEPSNVPDEYRYLCNYLDNPTSLIGWSCPTPKGGIAAELVLLEDANREALSKLDAGGKIILISSNTGGMKRYLDEFDVPGLVSDQIESGNKDFIDANNWMNTWSDRPGGWLMNAADSKNNFGFSVSQKKGDYLRNLLRNGRKVVVRATIDSRYFTEGSFPYVTGCIKGTGDEEVLIAGHMFEWGANDNSSGCASIMEAMGTLNDLILSGRLPRPRRSIRCWMGQEIYGSMAFTVHNLEKMRNKTIAAVCCDTPATDYDLTTTAMSVTMNFNACPSFTDGVFIEVANQYYSQYAPNRLWKTRPFRSGIDNFFGEPMIGVPINAISMNNGMHLHHNSMDTIEKVDPRTLDELAVLNAVYLYYMADVGYPELSVITRLTFDHGISVLLEKSGEMHNRIASAKDGIELGKLLYDGTRVIDYYTGLQKKTLAGIERIVHDDEKDKTRKYLSNYMDDIEVFGNSLIKRFTEEMKSSSKEKSINIVNYEKKESQWEKEAATIIPKRFFIGMLTYDGIPVEDFMGSPRWWSSGNWAAASYWWCDGKRNVNDIKELVELEAGRPVRNFDLVEYFRFLEKYDMVEFVEK